MKPKDALKTRPKKVCILGLGASIYDYVNHVVSFKGELEWDEVWAVNMGAAIFRHDKLWVMDDLRVQASKFPPYGRVLFSHDRPIITSTPYPDFPMSVRYPIEEVIEKVGDDFFRNTVCYAIGYAMVTGVKELSLYGCDFWYPQLDIREEGGQNAAYLLGLGRHFGMTFKLPQSTTLLSAHISKQVGETIGRPLYGYAKQPFLKEEKDGSGTGQGSRLREGQGIDGGAADASESGGAPVLQGRTAAIRAGRQNLRRGRAGDNGRAGVVLGGGEKDVGGGGGGVRPDSPGGTVQAEASPGVLGPDGESPAI